MGMNLKHYSILLFVILWASCANRGIGPQGGPKDTEPPIPLKSEPEMGALNWNGDRIEVTFNEYLELDNVSENLLMSPPQQIRPIPWISAKRCAIIGSVCRLGDIIFISLPVLRSIRWTTAERCSMLLH